jgi:hypothetical protein
MHAKIKFGYWITAFIACGFVMINDKAAAQTARVPLPLERPGVVYDHTLGSPVSADNGGSLVHVLSYSGAIRPPAFDGTPHLSNTVLFTTRVGAGVNANEMPGTFITSIIPRPSAPFFVRVYNAPTLDEATFYEDSNIHSPVDTMDVAFYPAMTATTNAIDTGDYDGDGINNSWERALGLNMSQQDTDGDGVSDAMEIAMGTDPLNANSVVPPFELGQAGPGMLVADWDLNTEAEGDAAEVLRRSLNEGVTVSSDPFANFVYLLQSSDGLPGEWHNLKTGLVGEWPAYMSMTESTNAVKFYRVIMQVSE